MVHCFSHIEPLFGLVGHESLDKIYSHAILYAEDFHKPFLGDPGGQLLGVLAISFDFLVVLEVVRFIPCVAKQFKDAEEIVVV
jgi:hypothetical protein